MVDDRAAATEHRETDTERRAYAVHQPAQGARPRDRAAGAEVPGGDGCRGGCRVKGRGDTVRTLRLFRRYAAGQRRSLVFAVLLLAAEATTAVALPALIGSLINFLKEGSRWRLLGFAPSAQATIPLLAAALVAVTAVNSLADSLAEISLAKAGRTLGFNLRGALFAHLQRLSLAFHLRRSTGDVLTRMTGDVKDVEDFVVESVSDLFGSVMLLVGTLAYLFWRSWRIALLALIIVPLLVVVSSVFARRIKAASKELRGPRGGAGVDGSGDAVDDQRRPDLRTQRLRAAQVRSPERLCDERGPAHGTAGSTVQLYRERARGTGHRRRRPGRCAAGQLVLDRCGISCRLHPADPGHVQTDPANRQGVEHGRKDLRQRGADQRAARPRALGPGRSGCT